MGHFWFQQKILDDWQATDSLVDCWRRLYERQTWLLSSAALRKPRHRDTLNQAHLSFPSRLPCFGHVRKVSVRSRAAFRDSRGIQLQNFSMLLLYYCYFSLNNTSHILRGFAVILHVLLFALLGLSLSLSLSVFSFKADTMTTLMMQSYSNTDNGQAQSVIFFQSGRNSNNMVEILCNLSKIYSKPK